VSPYTLSFQLWDCYATGDGSPGKALLTVTLRRKNGTVAATDKLQASEGGEFYVDLCSAPKERMRPGDTITVLHTRVDQRTFTIPDIQPRIDVVAGTASGTTPSGSLSITPQDCTARQMCLQGVGKVLLAGAWSRPSAGDAGTGGDRLDVYWSGGGLAVRSFMPVPYLAAKVGRSVVSGAAKPRQKVKVTLRTKAGKVRATGTARANGPDGSFKVTLRRHGAKVKVRTSDRVSSTLSQGAKLSVVPAGLAIDIGARATSRATASRRAPRSSRRRTREPPASPRR
jgi:hypothetical protein